MGEIARKMKVIMACREVYPFHYGYSGSPKYIYNLSKYLVKQGVDVEITTSLNSGKRRTEIYDGIKYTLIPPRTDRRLTALWCTLFGINLAQYLRGKDFDILHAYDVVPYVYLHLKNRAPVLYQPFGNEGLNMSKWVKRNVLLKLHDRFWAKPVWRYCGAHAELVAAEGDFQVEEMMNLYGIGRDRVSILPVGIDASFIKERLKARAIFREHLGLTDKDFVLLSVNALRPEKGIDYLIDALYILRHKLKNARLIIIGAGREEQKITDKIRGYNLIDSVKHIKNVPEDSLYDYYAMSDLYVSPTLQTDFILGILEAEVCGLPIVSTGQEWLIKEGENGYVVPQKTPQAMADAIIKVYEGNRKVMGIASQEIAEGYDFEHLAQLAIKIYQGLVRKTHL